MSFLYILVESSEENNRTTAYLLQDNRTVHYLTHTKSGLWTSENPWMFIAPIKENAAMIAQYIKRHHLDPMAGNNLYVVTVQMMGNQLPKMTIKELNIEDYIDPPPDESDEDENGPTIDTSAYAYDGDD
jgi:hypothetical protein